MDDDWDDDESNTEDDLDEVDIFDDDNDFDEGDDIDDDDDTTKQSESNVDDDFADKSLSDDEKAEMYFERLIMAKEDRLNELRDYADERELDEVLLLIPYCNPVNQGIAFLNEIINFKDSVDIGTTRLTAALFSIGISESPLCEFQRQGKEYNINYSFPDNTKENEESLILYPPLSKFFIMHDPFKEFNQIFLRLKDDDRAISWNYPVRELEIRLGDIKQQLSLKNKFSYVGMMDYKAILPFAELEKYSETKGYMGKKIKIKGVRYIVWVTEKEFKKLGEICIRLDSKLGIFKLECTKLANQFMTECTEQQNSFKKSIMEEYENSLNTVKKQREELVQENKLKFEKYGKKKRNLFICRILILLFSIVGLGISRIITEELTINRIIACIAFITLGFIITRKSKEPKTLKKKDMPPLPEEPVNKDFFNNKALDIFIDVLNREIQKAENRKQIGTAELRDDKKT